MNNYNKYRYKYKKKIRNFFFKKLQKRYKRIKLTNLRPITYKYNSFFIKKTIILNKNKLKFKIPSFYITKLIYLKLVNLFVKKGKKELIESLFLKLLYTLKYKHFKNTKLKYTYTYILIQKLLLPLLPVLEIRNLKRKRITFNVPCLITPYRQFNLLLGWFNKSIKQQLKFSLFDKIFNEFFELFNGHVTYTVQQRINLSKLLFENRRYAHYRWK